MRADTRLCLDRPDLMSIQLLHSTFLGGLGHPVVIAEDTISFVDDLVRLKLLLDHTILRRV